MFIRSGYSAHTRSTSEEALATRPWSCTKHHHGAACVLLAGRYPPRRLRAQAHLDRLPLKLCRAETIQLDHAALDGLRGTRRSAVGAACIACEVDEQSLALDQHAVAADLHAGRTAEVEDLAHAHAVRRRCRVAASAVEGLEPGGDRARERAAPAQMRAGSAQ